MTKYFRVVWCLLLLLGLSLVVGCGDETPASSQETTLTTTSATTSASASVTSSIVAPQTSVSAVAPTTEAPAINLYEEALVLNEEGVRLSSNAYISGFLTVVDSLRPYRFNLPTLVKNADIQSGANTIAAQKLMNLFGNKSQTYQVASSKLFVKTDAFEYLEAMMNAFAEDTGKRTVQVVDAYLYSGEESLSGEFVTGYSLALNVFEDGYTYSLASTSLTAEVNGETITYFDWFLDHCANYGFVYTGLSGDEHRTLALFRFVGVEHALVMKRYDVIDLSVYSNLIKLGDVKVTDPMTGYEWTISFYPADLSSEETVIPIPVGTIYTVSGNNIDGFIVSTRTP